ncbi:MAG: outer membrane protein assembly factor BamD [Flavipsychrobacter sp.]|nr:outer membrane protein assembly factor BamD [Flavipsychrobacter sp.]
MHRRLSYLLYVLFSISLLYGCSGYERALKSKDVNYKLKRANEFYEKKKYQQANGLYESLVPVLKNTRNYEPMYYRYAYSFYYLKDWLSASYHFKNYIEFFPTSKEAEEMEYLYGLCLYKMSPKASLEQTNTERAMDALQVFINGHPESKHVAEASKYIDECRLKLEQKEADAAQLYYNIGQYKAAGIAFKQVMRNFPESTRSDYYQYMTVKAWYRYAGQSIQEKQEERYATAINAYRELVDGYPNSKYLRDAEDYYTKADNIVKKIRNEHK